MRPMSECVSSSYCQELCDSASASDDIDPKSSSKSSPSSSGRIKRSDGMYLAYKERVVPKNQSSYRIIIVHGFASNKELTFQSLLRGRFYRMTIDPIATTSHRLWFEVLAKDLIWYSSCLYL
ncbi:hypothetical protein L1987_64202 [Smallanthus sonchifolius]|uniref:Uncharacterized protein n=1 Tax=Smallanthus sonchifolius TaxID=185202 RepID=A0ACB9CFE9_9ASTR|nr:hypothetical protein L1987_64202 [Smallanthus sonchifolius]